MGFFLSVTLGRCVEEIITVPCGKGVSGEQCSNRRAALGCVRDPVRSREELNQRAKKNRMAVRSGEERALAVSLLLEVPEEEGRTTGRVVIQEHSAPPSLDRRTLGPGFLPWRPGHQGTAQGTAQS